MLYGYKKKYGLALWKQREIAEASAEAGSREVAGIVSASNGLHTEQGRRFLSGKKLTPFTKPKQRQRQKPRPVSKRKSRETRLYCWLKGLFLAQFPHCVVESSQLATDIHHARGKHGPLFLDVRFWKGVSRSAHRKITDNPTWARDNGLICQRGEWDTPPDDEITRELRDILTVCNHQSLKQAKTMLIQWLSNHFPTLLPSSQ